MLQDYVNNPGSNIGSIMLEIVFKNLNCSVAKSVLISTDYNPKYPPSFLTVFS